MEDDGYLTEMDLYVENDFVVPVTSTYAIELEGTVRATLAQERMADSLARIADAMERG